MGWLIPEADGGGPDPTPEEIEAARENPAYWGVIAGCHGAAGATVADGLRAFDALPASEQSRIRASYAAANAWVTNFVTNHKLLAGASGLVISNAVTLLLAQLGPISP